MTRGPLAVVLALLVGVSSVRADDPSGAGECVLATPAPKGSARLRWRTPDGGEGTPGTWVSDPAMQRAAARVTTCIDGWTKCQVDLSVEKGKHVKLGWKAWAIGIGGAFVAGFLVGVTVR